MKEIKVEFIRHSNVLAAKVWDMPEELRGTQKIISDGTYSVMSHNGPDLYLKALYLNGVLRNFDNTYMCYSYKSSEQAKHAKQAFEKLIEKWNAEHREILDDEEKKYLAAVIKPFKKNIKYITKVRYNMWENDKKAERIEVLTHKSGGLCFPTFEVDTMYKGMEMGKRYSLKELGLE